MAGARYPAGEMEVMPDDIDTLPSGARRCKAMLRIRDEDGSFRLDENGDPCRRRCMAPAFSELEVCGAHGGRAARAAIAKKLLDHAPKAVEVLRSEMDEAPKSSDRLRAAENILDRAGFGRQASVSVEETRALLIARLIEIRNERLIGDEPEDSEVIEDAEIVEPRALPPGDALEDLI